MTVSGTYESRVVCGNCGAERRIEIPTGQQIIEQPCPKCGCKTLRRALWGLMPSDGGDVVYVHELRRLVEQLDAAIEQAERRGYSGLAGFRVVPCSNVSHAWVEINCPDRIGGQR